jgi:hypothetical protein
MVSELQVEKAPLVLSWVLVSILLVVLALGGVQAARVRGRRRAAKAG